MIEEWMPVGLVEEDAVLNIAKGLWRKRRVQKFVVARGMACSADPKHPAYDEAAVLRGLFTLLDIAPEIAFQWPLLYLGADKAEQLRQKFPRERFKSTQEWARAVQNEITSVLLPAVERFGELPPEILLFQSAAILSPDVFKHELAVEERIDAMIDRAVKRLVQAKAMKQMLGTTFSDTGRDQSKKLLSNKPDGSAKIVAKEQNGQRSDKTREATETQGADPSSS